MSWRVRVEPDITVDGVAVYMAERTNSGLFVVAPQDLATRMLNVPPGEQTPGPALRLSDELGRLLLDALAAHYGGSVDSRTLRGDYLHERARVDRLIGALIAPPLATHREVS